MSVRVTLNCQVKTDQFETLFPFLEDNLPVVRGFKGCIQVRVFFDALSNEMLLEEEWLSQDHHQAYLRFIDANGVLAQLASFLEQPPTIKYFNHVEV